MAATGHRDRRGNGYHVSLNEMASDPYNLTRFVQAQEADYDQALTEIRAGRKRSHWMWYVFPQFDGLGMSPTSKHYAIKSVQEARAYLAHSILGPRLIECAQAALQIEGRSALEVFGSPDDMKLRSSATLFASVSPDGSVFHGIIDKYFDGEQDARTIALLTRAR
jgi:uncharacterized protein (DUF1810 family)